MRTYGWQPDDASHLGAGTKKDRRDLRQVQLNISVICSQQRWDVQRKQHLNINVDEERWRRKVMVLGGIQIPRASSQKHNSEFGV